MNLDQLHTFLAVAKHLSLREASSEIGLTPPAISKQLASLQRNLGTRFYKRKGKGIELTEPGQWLPTKITPIVKQLDDLQELFRRKGPPEGNRQFLSVAGTFSLGAEFLPALIARYEKTHGNIEVQFHSGSSQQIQQLIRAGKAEIGLCSYRPLTADIIGARDIPKFGGFFAALRTCDRYLFTANRAEAKD